MTQLLQLCTDSSKLGQKLVEAMIAFSTANVDVSAKSECQKAFFNVSNHRLPLPPNTCVVYLLGVSHAMHPVTCAISFAGSISFSAIFTL